MDVTVGILGGGQLGRMLAQAAHNIGVKVMVLDPTESCPAAQVGAKHVIGKFTDEVLITEMAKQCDVMTVEIEHVNADALAKAQAASGVPVHPSPDTIALIQDKYLQKVKMQQLSVPLGDFLAVESQDAVRELAGTYGYPLMLKSRKMAYDGRGNAVVRSEADIAAAWDQLASKGQLYSERWVPFKRELAVIVARSIKGECVSYDAVETVQKNNICHVVVSPAQLPGNVLSRAREVAAKAVAGLAGAGVYGVELFELDDGSILLNEIAPRVHNSGHFTIEACNTSQFEQHIRCIVGLPLGSPAMRVGASVMINVLGTGATEADAGTTWDICQRALATPGASVHWYGKKGVALGRKVGHITLTGQWMPDVIAAATALIDGPVPRDAASSSSPSWSTSRAPVVGIIMGSDSDLPCMQAAAQTLEDFGVPFELTVVSAHRTPKRLFDYATSARSRGLKVIIAAAGGAAHLPGMVAAMTPLPVIGVPVPLKHLDGVDSLYSIVQMPRGVPVATVAIGNSTNAGLLAVRMLGSFVGSIGDGMEKYQSKIEDEVLAKVETLEAAGWKNYNVGAHK